MLQTQKINKDVVAVSFNPLEILLRKSGKAYFGKEQALCYIRDGKLVINTQVAKDFGVPIEMN